MDSPNHDAGEVVTMEEAMDMKKALNYAIHAEMEAEEFYRTWATETKQAHIRRELEELAQWESRHRDSLKVYYEELFGEPFRREPDLVVDPALKVQADEFRNHYALLRIASTAYVSEMRAAELYEALEKASSGDAAKMFGELKEMEQDHMATAKKRYVSLREDVVGFRAF